MSQESLPPLPEEINSFLASTLFTEEALEFCEASAAALSKTDLAIYMEKFKELEAVLLKDSDNDNGSRLGQQAAASLGLMILVDMRQHWKQVSNKQHQ